MGEPTTWITVALVTCSISAAVFASADTMTVTYRSGKVQSIVMDEPSQEVRSISYLQASDPLPELKVKGGTVSPADTGEGRKDTKKPGVSIKWAPPRDE